MTASVPSRHLTREGLLKYLVSNVPSVIRLDGDPVGFLAVEPSVPTIRLRFKRASGHAPELEPFRYFAASTIAWDGESWLEISVLPGADLVEAYPVLCAIADRVQIEGMPFHLAVVDALETYRELLAGLDRLTDDDEIGLIGELLVLRHLIGAVGANPATGSWRGPSAEEHDFSLDGIDLEVKTTTSEARRHWINDASQLVPSPDRDLWLLSIQITMGGEGSVGLPALIDSTRSLLAGGALDSFERGLTRARWRQANAALYRRTFRLRSQPSAFVVGSSFPAITPSVLRSAGLEVVRFPKIKYLLDLTGLSEDSAPFELTSLTLGDLP